MRREETAEEVRVVEARRVGGWMRFAEWNWSWFETRWSISKGTISYSQRWCKWANESDKWWKASAAKRLNSDKVVQVWGVSGCENFVFRVCSPIVICGCGSGGPVDNFLNDGWDPPSGRSILGEESHSTMELTGRMWHCGVNGAYSQLSDWTWLQWALHSL